MRFLRRVVGQLLWKLTTQVGFHWDLGQGTGMATSKT